MHKRTKASQIPKVVKQIVWERDDHRCLICSKWVPVQCACCHFISRARMGLGIEENIITLCPECHRRFDGADRRIHEDRIKKYLMKKYDIWNEEMLVYDKWRIFKR